MKDFIAARERLKSASREKQREGRCVNDQADSNDNGLLPQLLTQKEVAQLIRKHPRWL